MSRTFLGVCALAAGVALAACSSGDAGGPTPGNLAIHNGAASKARAVLLRVTGAPVTAFSAPPSSGNKVFGDTLAGDTTLILVVSPTHTNFGAGDIALFQVPNTHAVGQYHVAIVQVSDSTNADVLPGTTGLSVSVTAP